MAHKLDGIRKHQLLPATLARKIPRLRSTDGQGEDATAYVKLFSPYSNAVWYITEYDPSTGEAFGWADLGFGMGELGYISIPELEGLHKRGLPLVERDLYWKPRPLGQAKTASLVKVFKAASKGHKKARSIIASSPKLRRSYQKWKTALKMDSMDVKHYEKAIRMFENLEKSMKAMEKEKRDVASPAFKKALFACMEWTGRLKEALQDLRGSTM